MQRSTQNQNTAETGILRDEAAAIESELRPDWTDLGRLVRVEAARRAESAANDQLSHDITRIFRDRFGGCA